METILITGGTGLIGRSLSSFLTKKGFNVTLLSRTKHNKPNYYFWDMEKGIIEEEAIKSAHYIIHLAGVNIAESRWSSKQKKAILTSRTLSTNLLYEKVKLLNPGLKAFISASGVGYYGAITSSAVFTENDMAGKDFLSNVCVEWENGAKKFNSIGIRNVVLRTGVVFAKKGSALQKMSKPIKLGFGVVLGNGQQYIPWIHISDLCSLYHYVLINEKLNGVFNAVSPDHINNYELTHLISKNYKKKIWLPNVPAFVFRILLGEMSTLLTKGSAISPNKILKKGFKFRFSDIENALQNLIKP